MLSNPKPGGKPPGPPITSKRHYSIVQIPTVLYTGTCISIGLAQLISVVISWISLVFNSGRLFLFLRDGDHQIAHPPLVTSLKLAVLFLCPVSHLFLAFALAIVTFGKKYGLVLLFVWVLLKGLTSGSSLRSKHFAITFISSWIVPFSTQSRASFSSRHSIEFSNILKRKPTSLGRDMWAYFLFAQGILLSTIWLRANLDAQVSPFTGCVEVTDIVTSCATFVGGRLFNATSCFPEFWGTDSDNPPQIVRVCPSYSNDNTANYYFGGFAVGLFVLTLISLAFLNSLTTDVQLYKQLGLVTSSAIKDLMLEKFLKDRILGVENSGFFQTLVLCGRRVQTSDELLRKMIDSATLEMLIEPGVVSGVSCLEAASDKGFVDLVERMKKRGHWEPDHALNGGIFETGTPVREGKHFVLKIVRDNEIQRYTVTIEKHSQDTNENETGKTIADELESDFEIPRAMGLVKELSTFFWHFPPPSAGFAKEWYEIYKSLIQANYVRSREASEREQSSADTNDRTDQDFNERSPLLRRP